MHSLRLDSIWVIRIVTSYPSSLRLIPRYTSVILEDPKRIDNEMLALTKFHQTKKMCFHSFGTIRIRLIVVQILLFRLQTKTKVATQKLNLISYSERNKKQKTCYSSEHISHEHKKVLCQGCLLVSIKTDCHK